MNKENNNNLIISHNDSRSGDTWRTEAFNAIADEGNDELLIDITNKFDENEWEW